MNEAVSPGGTPALHPHVEDAGRGGRGSNLSSLSLKPFFPWLPYLLTGCLTDIFSPRLRGTQEVPTKEPSPEGTRPPHAESICPDQLVVVGWPWTVWIISSAGHGRGPCSWELGVGGG